MKEKVVRAATRYILRSKGAYVRPQQAGATTPAGTPDFLACLDGRFIAIECKATSKSKVSSLQKKNLEDIRKAGGVALVIHSENLEELYNL
jgi:Holliday junction resolvase